MSSVLVLTFPADAATAAGAWPVTVSVEPSYTRFTRTNLRALRGIPGTGGGGWRPAAGELARVDASAVEASFGEFSVDVWLDAVAVAEPIALVSGEGSPLELTLVPGTADGTFQAVASIRTSAAPVVLISGDLSVGSDQRPVRLGVWVSGSDAVLSFQGDAHRRLRFARSIPDARGEIVVAGPAAGSTSTIDVIAVVIADELDAGQDAELGRAAAEGIGEIDSLVASGTAGMLGAPEGPEEALGAVRWRKFPFGLVCWSAATGAHVVSGRILKAYTAAGGPAGRLGLPTSPEMGLDALLTWLRVPSRFTRDSLLLKDVLTHIGDLGAHDLVIEHAVPKKPDRRPVLRDEWDSVVALDPRLSEGRAPRVTALDADWVAGVLGHTAPDRTPRMRRRGRGEEGVEFGNWRRRRGAEQELSPFLTEGGFTELRGVLTRFASGRQTLAEAAEALWGGAKVFERSDGVTFDAEALHRVIRVPEGDGGITVSVPGSRLDVIAAAAVREVVGAQPAEVVTIAASAATDFAAGVAAALESGEVSAAQVSALSPHLVLRTPSVADLVGAPGGLDAELATVDDDAFAGLLAQSMEVGTPIKVEVEGAVWALIGPRAQLFQHGALIAIAEGVYEIGEHILSHWALLGGTRGFLGAPRASEVPVAGGPQAWSDGARWVPFENGRIYWSAPTGAHEVHGAILARYVTTSSSGGALFTPSIGELLGPPITDEQPVEGVGGARVSAFLRGQILWSAGTGAWEIFPEVLSRFASSGGVRRWGLPTGPQTVRANGTQRLITQPFQRGTLAITVKDGTIRAVDSLEVVIARVVAGDIDDDTLILRDRDAELIVKAQVWADDEVVLNRTSPRGGRVATLGWSTPAIDAGRLRTLRVRIEAWDWDQTNDDDLIGVIDRTFTAEDGYFGYASGGAWGMHADEHRQGDALAPVRFEYTIGREVEVSLERLREDFFWQKHNAGRAELPWKMFRDTFDDIDADTRGDADPYERTYYDDSYRTIADGGNCAGFSVTTIDAFLRRDLTQPVADADLQIAPENGFWQKINIGQGRQLASTILSWRADGSDDDDFCDPRRVFSRVNDTIARTGAPAILFFWYKKGDKKGGHAVLVWNCEVQGSTRVMHLADSNTPFPDMPNYADSRIEIEGDGSYRVFPTDIYGDWKAEAWRSGERGGSYMIDIPYGLYSDPVRSPAFDLDSGFLGLLGGVFSADGAGVAEVSSGSRRLYGSRTAGIGREWDQRSAIVDAVVKAGFATWAQPVAEAPQPGEGLLRATALDGGRLAALAEQFAPGLRGAELESQLAEAIRIVPGAVAASDSWKSISKIDAEIAAGGWLRPTGWPGVADVSPADDRDDGPTLIAFRGAVPDDVRTELVGRGIRYRLTMMGRSGVVTVSAPLDAGRAELVDALSLSSVRPGVVVAGAAAERVASVSLEVPVRQGSAVAWTVPLGLGAEQASVRWLAGRPGLEVRHATAVPETTIEWGASGALHAYRAPGVAAGERVRVLPEDPASPFGAIRLQRRSAVGDLLGSDVIDPAG